jgi:hypothetical protein
MKLILLIPTTICLYFFSLFDEISLKSEKKEIDFNTIKKEIEWFIDKVKDKSYKQGRHNVYVARFSEGCNEGDYCVTIGYIENGFLFRRIKECKYYLLLKDDLIILDYSNDFKEKYLLKNADCIKLLITKQIITDKIDMDLYAIGTWPGYVCCYETGKIKKVFYENSDEIPSDKSIFNMTPAKGITIEIDSGTFKKMLKEK